MKVTFSESFNVAFVTGLLGCFQIMYFFSRKPSPFKETYDLHIILNTEKIVIFGCSFSIACFCPAFSYCTPKSVNTDISQYVKMIY